MKIEQIILERFDELIQRGEAIGSKAATSSTDSKSAQTVAWATNATTLLGRVFGGNSEQVASFRKIPYNMMLAYGLPRFKALKEDYERGYLTDVRRLIQAEVFSDFLGQSEALLKAGYFGPAAVVAGCVLEDGLRNMCLRCPDIKLKPDSMMNFMNDQLAVQGVYSAITKDLVSRLIKMRNDGAHNNGQNLEGREVRNMIDEVRTFMGKFFVD